MKKITIIGLGLIGGSLGLALKKAKARDIEIIGFSRSPETVAKALKYGAIDRAAPNLVSSVIGADVVVIATPVMTTKDVLRSISGHLSPGCVVTDAGSTKVEIMKWAEEYLKPDVSFVGGHPMAGKETSGIDEADAELFRGCVYCLVKGPHSTPAAMEMLKGMAESIGARSLLIDAETHDNLVAGVSHLPFLLSAAFVTATTKSRLWPEMSRLAASGYRDVSRLASGNADMNRDICLSNRERITEWLDRYIEILKGFREMVAEDSDELGDVLAQAREAREKWLQERKA